MNSTQTGAKTHRDIGESHQPSQILNKTSTLFPSTKLQSPKTEKKHLKQVLTKDNYKIYASPFFLGGNENLTTTLDITKQDTFFNKSMTSYERSRRPSTLNFGNTQNVHPVIKDRLKVEEEKNSIEKSKKISIMNKEVEERVRM